jgi:hypothetical protein
VPALKCVGIRFSFFSSRSLIKVTMLSLFAPFLFLLQSTLAAPVEHAAAAATVGKIRGVADPVYHLYLQANSKNSTLSSFAPVSFPFLFKATY